MMVASSNTVASAAMATIIPGKVSFAFSLASDESHEPKSKRWWQVRGRPGEIDHRKLCQFH